MQLKLRTQLAVEGAVRLRLLPETTPTTATATAAGNALVIIASGRVSAHCLHHCVIAANVMSGPLCLFLNSVSCATLDSFRRAAHARHHG